MKTFRFIATALLGGICALGASLAWAQQAPAPEGTPAHLVVTVEPHKGASMPVINREDVMVLEGHNRDKVIDWVPAQGDHAALELFIFIDDSSRSDVGQQLEDIRKFINTQPPSTKIGVAYMRNGTALIAQDLTTDRALAAKALRLPIGIGGAEASPYFALSDLVKNHWPASNARRVALLVTDGIDRYYGAGDLQDPYLDEAIDDALRAGVMVSAIYNPDAGHFGHSYWQTYWGQIYLSHLADETGGEAYYIGFTGPAVAFAPYLDDEANRLQHQYLLTFMPQPQKKAGWQRVRVRTEVPKVDLVSAGKIYVSAGEK